MVDRDLLKPKHPMEALLKQRADGVLYLKVGDIVLYGKYAGQEMNLDGDDFLIMREDDILVVLEG